MIGGEGLRQDDRAVEQNLRALAATGGIFGGQVVDLDAVAVDDLGL